MGTPVVSREARPAWGWRRQPGGAAAVQVGDAASDPSAAASPGVVGWPCAESRGVVESVAGCGGRVGRRAGE